MKSEFFIGVDPGMHGGIAVLTREGTIVLAKQMPATDRDVIDILRQDGLRRGFTRAILERAASSRQMGRASAFKFGVGYGALRMALTAAEISFDEAAPAKWQRAMQCLDPTPKALGKKDKNITKRRAQQVFPTITVTHAIADALLLAEYCRRFFRASSR